MREEGNVITLEKREQYYSAYADERYWLLSGGVQVLIVPWYDADRTDDREAGRAVVLKAFTAGDACEIPAFLYRDAAGGNTWRFCLKATEEGARFEVRQGVTRVLKRNFLREAGIDSYEAEGGAAGGFENSLIACWKSRQARETAFIHQGERNDREVRRESLRTIAEGIREDAVPAAEGSVLYRTVRFGAVKCGIDSIEEEAKAAAACPGRELTVPDIARASHFICREITLDMDWYRSDCGVIVAFLPVPAGKDARGRDRTDLHPVACWRKGNRYQYYDGSTETSQPLTKAVADTLEPKAFSIRRTLPRRPLAAKDVVRFVTRGIRARELAELLLLGILTTAVGVLLPKMNQLIYDEYIPLGDRSLIVQVCFVLMACMVGSVFISIVRALQETRIPGRAGYELQDAVYHRLFELPESFFRGYDSAELADRVSAAGGVANTILGKVLSNGFTLAVSVLYWIQMIRYSGKLTAVCAVMLLVFGAAVYGLSRRSLRWLRQIEEYRGEADGRLYQLISGVEKIRMAGAEERAVLEYTTPVANEKRLTLRTGRNATLLAVLIDAGGTVFSMVLYYMMIRSGLNISMGAFIAFTTAFGSVTSAVTGAVQAAADCTQLKPVMERIAPVLRTAPEDEDGKDVVTHLEGRIDVEGVTFGYAKDQPPVLDGVTLHVRPGEYVAVVGPSGCGKSTLLKLLLGFEMPDAGRVLYDGKDMASVDRHSLRKNLGVVLQNGRLIAGSICENITITSPKPDLQKVWAAIEDVGLREDVENMPMGIHTVLSESGGTISGGQLQRILIARAIYSDPAVLFFDEATSALDNRTQAKVCESLEKRHMTRLVIAHRLSTIRKCDRILVMDAGRIVEEGNYEQLMRLKGRFWEMAVRQLVSPEDGGAER